MATTISPNVGPSIGESGTGSDSITVTGKPRARHEAATSSPMNPAPTIATRAHAKAHVERERVVSLLLAEKGLLRLPGALEHLLRERRAVVGAMWLVANQRELTIEASVAQRFGRTQARERGANDDDAAQHRSTSLFY